MSWRRVRKSVSKTTGIHGFFSGKKRRQEVTDRKFSAGDSFAGTWLDQESTLDMGIDANPLFQRRPSAEEPCANPCKSIDKVIEGTIDNDKEGADHVEPENVIGCRVQVKGTKRADLNGSSGIALSWTGERYNVKLESGNTIALKPANVDVVAQVAKPLAKATSSLGDNDDNIAEQETVDQLLEENGDRGRMAEQEADDVVTDMVNSEKVGALKTDGSNITEPIDKEKEGTETGKMPADSPNTSPALSRALSGATARRKQRRHTFSDSHWVSEQNLAGGGKNGEDDTHSKKTEKKHKERQLANYMKQFQQTKQAFLPHGEIPALDEATTGEYKTAVTEALKFVVGLYPSRSKMPAFDYASLQAVEQIELNRLFARLQGWRVQPGDWVIQKDKLCDRFVVIAEGKFVTATGDDVDVGTYFNETALILPTNSLHSVKAESNGVVFTLLRKDLVDFIRKDVQEVQGAQLKRTESTRVMKLRRASSMLGLSRGNSELRQNRTRRSSVGAFKVSFSHLRSSTIQKPSFADFTELRSIGKGTFGNVKLVQSKKDGKTFAMKVYKKAMMLEYGQGEHVQEESRLMTLIDNQFIAKIEVCCQDSANLYLIMELINGGELTSLIYDEDSPIIMEEGGFKEETARFYAANIICMLEHLHQFHSIVYRDLKPENVILSSKGYLKLVDFGFARKLPLIDNVTGKSSMECYDKCGSPHYVAPEVILESGHGFPVDWWSLGVLIYEMATGALPFDHKNDIVLFRKIKQGKYSWDSRFDSDDEDDQYVNLRDVVKGLLNVDPKARSQFVANVREHAWFQMDENFDWAKITKHQAQPPHIPVATMGPEDDPEPELDDTEEQTSDSDWWPEGFDRV